MKRIICVMTAVLMLFALAACSQGGGIGSLKMDDTRKSGVGKLGEPAETEKPESQEPSDEPEPEPSEEPEPEPTREPEPTQEPAPEVMETEQFSNDLFSMTIPKGWKVDFREFNANPPEFKPLMRLNVFVVNPDDPNSMIFYGDAYEPYFEDVASKNAYAEINDMFEYAPVLLEGMSMESVIKEWASGYTLMQREGITNWAPFKNYQWQKTVQTIVPEGNTSDKIVSAALCEVKIMGGEGVYGMFMEGTLVRTNPRDLGLGSFPYDYFISYGNAGIVADVKMFNTFGDTLIACKNSIDTSGFRNKHSLAQEQKQEDPFSAVDPGLLGK